MRGNHGQRNKKNERACCRTNEDRTGLPTDPVPACGPVGQPFIRKPLTIRDNYSSENSKSLQPFLSLFLSPFRRAEKIEELRGEKEPAFPNSRLTLFQTSTQELRLYCDPGGSAVVVVARWVEKSFMYLPTFHGAFEVV